MGDAHFINVDLELFGAEDVAIVVAAFGDDVHVLHQRDEFAGVELALQPKTIGEAIDGFAALIVAFGDRVSPPVPEGTISSGITGDPGPRYNWPASCALLA